MKVQWTCPVCGISVRVKHDTPRIFCACGYRQDNGVTPGLGDHVAAGLHKIGITQERYTRAKAAVGLKRKCGCSKRQKMLNKMGRKMGIGR